MLFESESDILATTSKISLDIYYKLLALLFRSEAKRNFNQN